MALLLALCVAPIAAGAVAPMAAGAVAPMAAGAAPSSEPASRLHSSRLSVPASARLVSLSASPVAVPPSDDSFVRVSDPAANFDEDPLALSVTATGFPGGVPEDISYLRFDVSLITGTLTAARLRVYNRVTPGSAVHVGAFATIDDDWNGSGIGLGDETTLTGDTAPTEVSKLDEQPGAITPEWMVFESTDLTSYVESQMAGDRLVTLRLKVLSTGFADVCLFEDREDTGGTGNAPELVLEGVTQVTATPTATATDGPSPTASATATSTMTAGATASATASATSSATPDATTSTTPAATATSTVSGTPGTTPDATPSTTPDATPSTTPDATPSTTPDATSSATGTATDGATATASATVTSTDVSAETSTPTETAVPTGASTATITSGPSPTAIESPTTSLTTEPTPSPGATSTDSATSPTPGSTPTGTPPSVTPAVTGTATGTPECTTHTTKLELLTSQPEVRVGDSVTVTLRLSNIGCAPVGLPAYNLLWSADGSDELFARRSPLSQSFSVGISPGGQHEAEFVLLAVRPGVATFSAHVSFEVHLGYPGPAYWSGDQAGPVALVIREPLPPTIYLPMALNRGGVVSVGRVSAAATVLRR